MVTSRNRVLLSRVLIIAGVIVLFFAEDAWVSGAHTRGLILALVGLIPLIWGLRLSRQKREGGS